MASWIDTTNPTGIPEMEPGTSLLLNGVKIYKPRRFKNKAHERAFEIALVLAQKKPASQTSRRMGDMILVTTSPIFMTSVECIDTIMFKGDPEIQLDINAVNPRKPAHDAMKMVPGFFDPGVVVLGKRINCKKMWYLEIKRDR